jgi:hypothetical protein
MSIEVSPPLIFAPPPPRPAPPSRVEPNAIKRRESPSLPPPATSRLDVVLNRVAASRSLWLTPVLLLQAVLCLRLSNGMSEDEAQSINAGHQLIAHILHGTPTPAFGSYFAGVPSLFAVPAAMLDHVGGASLIRGTNTGLVLIATVLVYLATRRIFGQGAAIVAAAVFAINPATIFAARFASVDAPCLLTLAAAFYFAIKAWQRRLYPVLAGALLATAAAEKYVAILFIPGALVAAYAINAQRVTRNRAALTLGVMSASVVGGLIALAALAHHDWHGFTANALGGHTFEEVAGSTLLHDGWDYIGVLAVVAVASLAVVTRDRRGLAAPLCAAGLLPVVVQILWHDSASLQRNIAFSMVFLAPVLGAGGTWLMGQGRWLAVRAPLALMAGVLLLSTGMGTSASMIHSWPTSTSIDAALRYYVHDGNQRYLVDGNELPAYYLSDVTGYNQWVSTLDGRYSSAGGTTRLREDLQDAAYRLVLYRDNDATPGLDKLMVATLRNRYTLVARVPVSPGNTNTYWSLWLAELPR